MTVAELIKALESLPSDLEIRVHTADFCDVPDEPGIVGSCLDYFNTHVVIR